MTKTEPDQLRKDTISVVVIVTLLAPITGVPQKCESPWRTFRSVCFLFSDTNNQKFNEAQEYCYKRNSFLASIRNSAEHGFIVKTIQGMGSSYQRVRWFIGLYQYDAQDNKAYRWLDGSVSGFRNWMSTQPNSIYERCAQLDGSNGFKWRDDMCTLRALFICRRDLDEKGSMSCFKGHPPPSQILEKAGISVTECLEHCRGLGFPLAGLVPGKCFCLGPNNLQNLEVAKRSKCNGNCENQHCGNKDFITIYNLTFYKDTAESCEDLSLLGFSSPSTYVTKVGDEEKLQNCFSDDTRYTATSSFHIPDLINAGTPVYRDGPVTSSEDGQEGFGSSADFGENNEEPERSCLKLSDLSSSGAASEEHLKCWRNPINCKYGFSASIWAKIPFKRKESNKRYVFSTGGDEVGTPGVAVYYRSIYLYALVSTGENIWSVHAAGLVMNDTWSNIAFSWSQTHGLDLLINGKREAYVKYPEPPPPPLRPPLKPLQLTIGCRRVKKEQYEDFVQGKLDEFVTWQYRVPEENSSYFLGGLDPSKLCKPATHPLRCSTDMRTLLKKIDSTDMSDIDVAMTAIMHVTEVIKALPKGSRSSSKPGDSAGSAENTGDKGSSDGAKATGTGKKKPRGKGKNENADDKENSASGNKGKGSTSSGNDIDEDNASNDEGNDYLEDEEVDVEQIRLGNLRNMIAIVKKLVNKTSGPFSPGASPEDLGVLYKMQEIVSTILSENNVDMWKQMQAEGEDGLELANSVQQWAMTKLMESTTEEKNIDLVMISDNIATWSAKSSSEEMKKKHEPYIYFPEYTKDPKWQDLHKKWNYPRNQLRVTTNIFNNSDDEVSIQSVLYNTFHQIAPQYNSITGSNTSRVLLDSRVINFEVKPSYNKAVLKNDAVIIVLEHYLEKTKVLRSHPREIIQEPKIESRECVRWSKTLVIPGRMEAGGWTTEGCAKVNSTTEYTTCACDSLGMYTLLAFLQKPKTYVEPEDETWVFALKGLGYSFSIIALICYISAIAMRPSLHDQFHIIRLNLSIAAVGTMLSFFSVDFKRHDWEACRVLSGFIHYFYLVVGCWMGILTHALFKGFIKGIVDGRICFYQLLGWGLPLVWVGVVVASSPNYGYDDRCMVGPTRGMRCSLACPLVFLGMTSLVWSAVVCCNLSSPQIKRIEVVQELNYSTKMLFCMSLGFTVIWVIGIIALLELDEVNARGWRKLFQIFNSWLGLLIVFFLGLGSKHFRYAVFDKYMKYFQSMNNQVNPTPFEYNNGYRFDYKSYYTD